MRKLNCGMFFLWILKGYYHEGRKSLPHNSCNRNLWMSLCLSSQWVFQLCSHRQRERWPPATSWPRGSTRNSSKVLDDHPGGSGLLQGGEAGCWTRCVWVSGEDAESWLRDTVETSGWLELQHRLMLLTRCFPIRWPLRSSVMENVAASLFPTS